MVTAAQITKLALAMPDVVQKAHFEQPDFRVGGKIFADLSRDGKRATLKLTPVLQQAVMDSSPSVFSPAPGAWGRAGWTFVVLAHAKRVELAHLLAESWRLVAPKGLVAAAVAAKRI